VRVGDRDALFNLHLTLVFDFRLFVFQELALIGQESVEVSLLSSVGSNKFRLESAAVQVLVLTSLKSFFDFLGFLKLEVVLTRQELFFAQEFLK
jgi:hypothetical protein